MKLFTLIAVAILSFTTDTLADGGDRPLSQQEARTILKKGEDYIRRNCTGKPSGADGRCGDYAASVLYSAIRLGRAKDFSGYAKVYPAVNQDTHCDTYYWTKSKGNVYAMDARLAYYVINRERNYEDTDNIYLAFLCRSFFGFQLSGKAPPDSTWPDQPSDFVSWIRRDSGKKAADEADRFVREIGVPYAEAYSELHQTEKSREKLWADLLELSKNASDQTKSRGFSKRYITFVNSVVSYNRKLLSTYVGSRSN